jgi:phage terminase small subunit
MNAPEHLDEQARAKWQEIAPTLPTASQGTLDALAAYCGRL